MGRPPCSSCPLSPTPMRCERQPARTTPVTSDRALISRPRSVVTFLLRALVDRPALVSGNLFRNVGGRTVLDQAEDAGNVAFDSGLSRRQHSPDEVRHVGIYTHALRCCSGTGTLKCLVIDRYSDLRGHC